MGIACAIDSGRVSGTEGEVVFGRMITLGPKARNSCATRRLASVWRLRRAAETAAPTESARRMTKRRRRIRRRNIERFVVGCVMAIRLEGWERVRSVWRGGAGGRCQEA